MLEFENNYIRMDLIHLSQLNDIELTQMDFSRLTSYQELFDQIDIWIQVN